MDSKPAPLRQDENEFISHLLAAECNSTTAEQRIKALSTDALRKVLAMLSSQSQHSRTIELLRFFWACQALQPTVLSILCCSAEQSDLSSQPLLNEVEVLLGADARDGSQSPEERIQMVSRCATAVCLRMQRKSTPAAITLLVFCAHAAAQVHTQRSRAVQSRIIRYILSSFESPTNLRVSPVLAMLNTDIRLSEFEDVAFMRALDSFVSRHCTDRDVPAVFQAVVSRLGRVTSARQTSTLGVIALHLLSKTSPCTLSNALDVLSTLIMDSEVVASRLVDALSHLVQLQTTGETLTCTQPKVGPPHVSLILSLLSSTASQSVEKRIHDIFERIATPGVVRFDNSQVPSSSAAASEPPFVSALRFIARKQIPAVWANGETLACVFEGQVWSEQESIRSCGMRMLFEVFLLVPRSRKKILRAILIALTNEDTPKLVTDAFCHLLEQICGARETAIHLRAYALDLHALLNFADAIPMHADCRVVTAIAQLSVDNPQQSDRVISFLRKAAGSRLLKLQRIAGAGFLALIEHDAIPEEIRDEVLIAFADILALSEPPLRAYLIQMMIEYVDKNGSHPSRIRAIADIVVQHVRNSSMNCSFCDRKSMQAATGKGAEKHSAFGQSTFLEPLFGLCCSGYDAALLMRLCRRIGAHHPPLASFYWDFGEYLGDVKQVLKDIYSKPEKQGSTIDRVTKVCELYLTRICNDTRRSSERYLTSYAVCLLIRALEESNNRSETSSRHNKRYARSNGSFAVLGSVSAREAVAMGLSEAFKNNITGAVSFKECIEGMRWLANASANVLLRRILFREFMSIAGSRIRQLALLPRLTLEETETFAGLIKSWFIATSPWATTESEHNPESPCSANTHTRAEDWQATPLSSKKQPSFGAHPWDCKECVDVVTGILSEVGIAEIQSAWDSETAVSQLSKLSTSLRLSIRSSCMTLLIRTIQDWSPPDRLALLHSILQAARPLETFEAASDSTQHAQGRGKQTGSEFDPLECNPVVKEIHSKDMDCNSQENGSHSPEGMKILQSTTVLSGVFRLEFQHGISVALTLSYFDLFIWLRKEAGDDCESEKRTRAIIVSTMSGLLRDFSIRQSTVLRRMLSLLLDCFDVLQGIEFATVVVRYLRDGIALDDRRGEVIGTIGTQEFDADIIEEAINLDIEMRGIDTTNVCPPKHEDAGHHSPKNQHNLGSEQDQAGPDTDSIRTLCLGETEDNAVMSIFCVLEYLGRTVRHVLERRRRAKSKSYVPSESELTSTRGVLGALRELLVAPFMRFPVTKTNQTVLLLWRRLGVIMQSLTEFVEIQIRLLPTHMCAQQETGQPVRGLLDLVQDMLQLLFEEGLLKLTLSSPQLIEQRPRSVFLQERLDATATAFVLCHESEASPSLKGILLLLQERVKDIGSLKRNANEKSENWDGVRVRPDFQSRPKKRAHFRSRNRYVDGWLQEENGDDNYVDLEDFIVPLEGDTT